MFNLSPSINRFISRQQSFKDCFGEGQEVSNWVPLVPLPWRRRPALLPLSRLGICSSDLKQVAGLDRALKKSCINLIDFDS
jgi:hypothetical protein